MRLIRRLLGLADPVWCPGCGKPVAHRKDDRVWCPECGYGGTAR